jgi:hypothetical protein
MSAASLLGRRDMVVRFYQQCERALHLDLGVRPMGATTELRDALLRDAPRHDTAQHDERRLVGASAGASVGVSMWLPAGEGTVVPSTRPLSRFR